MPHTKTIKKWNIKYENIISIYDIQVLTKVLAF